MNFGVALRYVWWRKNLNFDTHQAKKGQWCIYKLWEKARVEWEREGKDR
jgi:hypothetical protein